MIKCFKCRSDFKMWHVYSHCIVDSTKNGGNIPPIFKFIIKYSKEGKAWGRGTSSLGDHRLHGGEAQGRENQGTRVLGGPWLYLPSWSLGREGRQLSNGNEATAWARSCGLFPGNQVEHRLREPQKDVWRQGKPRNHQSLQKWEYSTSFVAPESRQYRTNCRGGRKVPLAEKNQQARDFCKMTFFFNWTCRLEIQTWLWRGDGIRYHTAPKISLCI